MSLSKNINEAFKIVTKTYENTYKLLDFLRIKSREEDSDFELKSPRILHDKSINEDKGWWISQFILVFQNKADELLPNNWRDGPVYVVEINLFEYNYDYPTVTVIKYEYKDNEIKNWIAGCKNDSENYNGFRNPWYDVENIDYDEGDSEGVIIGIPNNKNEDYTETDYWGLLRVVGIEIPLAEITRDNACDKIFGSFCKLMNK